MLTRDERKQGAKMTRFAAVFTDENGQRILVTDDMREQMLEDGTHPVEVYGPFSGEWVEYADQG